MLNLSRTGDRVNGLIQDIVREHGLTLATSHILAIIDSAGRPLSPHTLSRQLVVSRASVTGLLDALEKRSLIRRRPHPEDRRMLLIELTEEARTVLAAFRPLIHQEELRLMSCLSEREQRQLLRLLGRVQARLDELDRLTDRLTPDDS
jgi:DNA-binding MarR family transcriptional regulator